MLCVCACVLGELVRVVLVRVCVSVRVRVPCSNVVVCG